MQTLIARLAVVAAVLVLTVCDDSPGRPGGGGTPPDTSGGERVLLEVPQWQSNHNGGGLAFDNDGFLYLGLGDGGGAGDNQDNGQDPTNLLGTILRIRVIEADPYYEVPGDNPFVGNPDGWREEIFAYGFRNPWRISVDPATNTLWAGDVGQDAWEEVDVVESGGNYGWDCREGMHEYTGPSSVACTGAKGFTDPVWEYAHQPGNGSITGGVVYRGSALSGLVGRYVYADYINGNIWALEWDGQNASNQLLADAPFPVSSFGVDESGELYVLQYAASAKVHRLEDAGGGTYQVVAAFPDLTFSYPVDLRNAGDGSGRLFVVEQNGVIRAFDTSAPDSMWTFEDFTGRVVCCGEQGLLGLAFHPDFATNGFYYVYYTTNSGGLVGRLSRMKAQ